LIRFCVFDLDGTLVDSCRDLANAANALVRELGGVPLADDKVAQMVGEGAAVLVTRVLSAARLDPATHGALPRFLELYDERLIEHTAPYDGTVEMLEALGARMPLGVLTNKPQQATDRLLGELGLSGFFQRVIGGDTAMGRKPVPTALLGMCEDIGVAPADTVLVGDSAIDLQTARNAGTRILLVSYGFGFRFAPEDLLGVPVVNSTAGILAHVAPAAHMQG
jgi:phosphoglycolate phosphatase